jgi:hypothetical protein
MLKIYLRCLIFTDSLEIAQEIPLMIFKALKGKKEVNALQKLVDFISSEIDYLFMQKKMFLI